MALTPSNPSEPTHVVVVKVPVTIASIGQRDQVERYATHMVVKVPVTIASIGQRDQVERYATHMVVEFDGSNVTLKSDPPTQAGTDTITFPWAGIEAAIGVLGG